MTTRRLFVALLAIALFVMSVRETLDPDMWWHLRTGEAIWQHGSVPTYDLFSFTVPHHEWVVQQWLTDALMWLIYDATGLVGLSVVFALVVTAAFMLVYGRCAGQPYLAAFVILLAYFAAALPMGARPQMFNMLFLALFINLLEGVKNSQMSWRWLYWLPAITVIWANMHSGYLTGVALLVAYMAGESLQRRFGRPDERTLAWAGIRRLALVTILALFAAVINPHGYKLWLFPLLTLGSSPIQSNIVEWRSPDFHLVYFWFFGVMMIAGILSWLFSWRRPTWTELFVFGGSAAAGLLSARHIPLFAVAGAPIIAGHLLSSFAGTRFYPLLSGRQAPSAQPRTVRLLNTGVLLLALLAAAGWVQTRLQHNDRRLAEHFPVAAVDFVEEEGLAARRIYNTYEWGGYLIWRRIPVFIDGRTELYGNDFFLYYLQTIQLSGTWQRPLDEMNVDYVLLKRSSSLAMLLMESDDWHEVYEDEVARIFVRQDVWQNQ